MTVENAAFVLRFLTLVTGYTLAVYGASVLWGAGTFTAGILAVVFILRK